MDELLGNLYDCFKSFYGQPLSDYLWGYSCETEDFSNPNLYNTVGIITLIIVGLSAFIYYYVHKPTTKQRVIWFIYWFSTSILNLVFAFLFVLKDYENDLIGDCLKYAEESTVEQINPFTCFYFGLANGILTLCLFFILSMVMKWKSTTGKYYPF